MPFGAWPESGLGKAGSYPLPKGKGHAFQNSKESYTPEEAKPPRGPLKGTEYPLQWLQVSLETSQRTFNPRKKGPSEILSSLKKVGHSLLSW